MADDPVQDAVTALATASVYVHPAASGVDGSTATDLASTLTEQDQIVLVMLPASVASATRTPEQIAQTLSAAVGEGKIVGVAVGKTTVGYAPRFGPGVAQDQMARAASVNNATSDALSTYVLLVHRYQQTDVGRKAMNPPPATTRTTTGQPPLSTSHSSAVDAVGAVSALVAFVCVLTLVVRAVRRRRTVAAQPAQVDNDGRAALTSSLGSLPEASGLPPTALASYEELRSDLSQVLTCWDTVSATPEVADEVRAVLRDYLPSMLRAYGQIPADLRTESRNGAQTPSENVSEQIHLLAVRVGQIRDAAYSGSMDALDEQSARLKALYESDMR